MKRWTLRIVLPLILGCVTTVAVAWGISYWLDRLDRDPGTVSEAVVRDHELIWCVGRNDAFGRTQANVRVFSLEAFANSLWRDAENFGRGIPRWVPLSDALVHRGGEWPPFVVYRACGWPMRCLLSRQVHPDGSMNADHPTGAIWIRPTHYVGTAYPVVLPLRPIWPGFVINTLFYGVIWFAIFFAPGSARRALRKKRGRCPKCNYDLRGELDKGCPECGWGRPEG